MGVPLEKLNVMGDEFFVTPTDSPGNAIAYLCLFEKSRRTGLGLGQSTPSTKGSSWLTVSVGPLEVESLTVTLVTGKGLDCQIPKRQRDERHF